MQTINQLHIWSSLFVNAGPTTALPYKMEACVLTGWEPIIKSMHVLQYCYLSVTFMSLNAEFPP